MLPWGFILANGHVVATTSVRERNERAALGESGIALLERLGVSLDQQRVIAGRASAGEDALTVLEELQNGRESV